MRKEPFPILERISTKLAGLLLGFLLCPIVTLFGFLLGRIWLMEVMTLGKMFKKLVLAVARMGTLINITRPPFEMVMGFVLVANPIGFFRK